MKEFEEIVKKDLEDTENGNPSLLYTWQLLKDGVLKDKHIKKILMTYIRNNISRETNFLFDSFLFCVEEKYRDWYKEASFEFLLRAQVEELPLKFGDDYFSEFDTGGD